MFLKNSFVNGGKPHQDNKGTYDKENFPCMQFGVWKNKKEIFHTNGTKMPLPTPYMWSVMMYMWQGSKKKPLKYGKTKRNSTTLQIMATANP